MIAVQPWLLADFITRFVVPPIIFHGMASITFSDVVCMSISMHNAISCKRKFFMHVQTCHLATPQCHVLTHQKEHMVSFFFAGYCTWQVESVLRYWKRRGK